MHTVNEGEIAYKRLPEYFAMRKRELTGMVEPYIDVTNAYGELICSLVLISVPDAHAAARPPSTAQAASKEMDSNASSSP